MKRRIFVVYLLIFAVAASTSAYGGKPSAPAKPHKPRDRTSEGGQAQIATFAIATQAPGSMTFSVSTSNTGPFALTVTDKCYDSMSELAWTDDLAVTWDSSTVGHAGPTSPPREMSCVAYVHAVGSDTALAVLSYVTP